MRRVGRILLFISFFTLVGGISLSEASTKDRPGKQPVHTEMQGIESVVDTTIVLTTYSISENSEDSADVGRFRLRTRTSDIKASFFLISDANGRFGIRDDSVLIVKRTEKIDYEEHKSHPIEIGAETESGDTLRTKITIQVTDVNEPPEEITLSNRRIPENKRDSSVVGRFSVTDPDSGDQAKVQLLDDANGRFYIENRRLEVIDSARFNHEKESRVNIRVKAVDRQGAELEKSITIKIMDRNDPPTGIRLSNARIPEDAEPGTLIGKLRAVDEDSADLHRFNLLSSSGDLSVKDSLLFVAEEAELDHETEPVLSFKMRVRDSAGAAHTQPVEVKVEDVNEPPKIYSEPQLVMDEDARGYFYVRVEDPEYPDEELDITFQSDNPDLISRQQVEVLERGVRRKLRIRPRPDSNGVARVKARVSDGEYRDSTSFRIMVRPVNDAPYLVRNIERRLDEGARLLIDEHTLRVRDVDDRPSQIMYRIKDQPDHGNLEVGGDSSASSFNQKEVNKEKLWYQHDGSEHHRDTVRLTVEDSKGAKIEHITLPFDIVPINDPPQISKIADQIILEDHSTDELSFTVKDAETAGINLEVQARSSNNELIPDDSVHITGIDRFRSIKAIPAPNANGQTEITLSVNDGEDTTSTKFQVEVKPVNDPPQITAPDTLNMKEDQTAGPVQIRFDDQETKPSNLKWDIIFTNEQLINQEGIQLKGEGPRKRLYLNPRDNQFGQGSLVMSLSDGELTDTVRTFVNVKPVNDPPTEFSLFNTNVKQSTDSIRVDFNWEQAEDIENRGVKYILRIDGADIDTTINDISDNRFTLKAREKLSPNSEYQWWVMATDGKDTTESSSLKQFLTPDFERAPDEFKLYSNFPNPFNPITNIRYKIPTKSKVRVSVYDMSGRIVSELVNTVQSSGEYKVSWNAGDRASGIYVCRIVANGLNGKERYVETKKMMLVK